MIYCVGKGGANHCFINAKSNTLRLHEKANNATVAGIDTAGVGVRDDVHISIFTSYTSSAMRPPLMALGKTLQVILVNAPKTPDDAKKLEQSFNNNAVLALKTIAGLKPGEADQMNNFVFRLSLNTPARFNAYLQYKFLLGDNPLQQPPAFLWPGRKGRLGRGYSTCGF